MNWKQGSIRVWIVTSIVWLTLVIVVMRPDRDFSNYFVASAEDRSVVAFAYEQDLRTVESPTEAWIKLLQSPLFGEQAQRVSAQGKARGRLKEIVAIAFLPIVFLPISMLLIMRTFGWIVAGFRARE